MAKAGFDLTADADTLIYTVPAGKKASKNVLFVARSNDAAIRLAHTTGAAPANIDYFEYGGVLAVTESFEQTQIFMETGEKLYARADAAGVTVVVTGPEETA